jgi:uncharacterized repeat protein (TIGR01451 family)
MTYPGGDTGALARSPIIVSAVALAAALTFGGAPAHAAGTVAGTDISNTATATFDGPSGPSTISSNTVTLKVDELLDVSVVWADPGDVSSSPSATNQVLTFTITNAGNGDEAFKLTTVDTSGGDDFDPTVTTIVIDSNGNNAYDAGVDTVYVAGTDTPVLDPDDSLTVFVLSTIPAGAGNGDRGRVDLTAAASTGTGTPGTVFAGDGQGGGDAIAGATGADGEDDGYYVIAAATLALVKSATVVDPFNGTSQVPGSTITYTLVASASGSGSVANVTVNDNIPTGTTYVPASITLDGNPQTDLNDGTDDSQFVSTGTPHISVGLGSVAASSSYTITFKVKIDQ